MQRKNLKLGLLYSLTNGTDSGPGVIDHMELDAKTAVKFGAEYIKLGSGLHYNSEKGSIKFGKILNKTEKSIFFSCSFPYYYKNVRLTLT